MTDTYSVGSLLSIGETGIGSIPEPQYKLETQDLSNWGWALITGAGKACNSQITVQVEKKPVAAPRGRVIPVEVSLLNTVGMVDYSTGTHADLSRPLFSKIHLSADYHATVDMIHLLKLVLVNGHVESKLVKMSYLSFTNINMYKSVWSNESFSKKMKWEVLQSVSKLKVKIIFHNGILKFRAEA